MFTDRERSILKKLEMPYPAVAVKLCRNRPEGYEQAEEKDFLCCFLAKAQNENRAFYITMDNETCMGKVVLGMMGLDSAHGSNHGAGYMGKELGAFRTAAANARLYYEAPMIKKGIVNYVLFCPADLCDFTPDILICVADTRSAQLLLRASSYTSGDIWEAKGSYVMSCAWSYVYPYISGKVNHLFTGMHLGMQMKGVYPPGLHIITIPYQKLDEIINALYDMEWVLPFVCHDEESRAKVAKMTEYVEKLRDDTDYPIPMD